VNDLLRALAQAVDSESPREERGAAAVEIVRAARDYRWVGIYDVGDDESVLIARAGTTGHDEAIHTGKTIAGSCLAIVPILGAESGIVIGTLDVASDRTDAFAPEEVAFLEECAGAMRPLYD
jgi:putative methionine-R-sulfoxide reductase with GAF domain